MKKITELNDEQILALTGKELELMVKYQMAENGIKILKNPTEPAYLELPPKEVTAWEVKGVTNLFSFREDAEKVSDLIKSVMPKMVSIQYHNYEYSTGWLVVAHEHNYSFNEHGAIVEKHFYTKETADSVKEIVSKNKKTKSDYEADLKDYYAEQDKVKTIEADIWGAWQNLQDIYASYETMKARYNEYLELAENDAKMAMKFLKKAYTVDRETENYILHGSPNDPILSA